MCLALRVTLRKDFHDPKIYLQLHYWSLLCYLCFLGNFDRCGQHTSKDCIEPRCGFILFLSLRNHCGICSSRFLNHNPGLFHHKSQWAIDKFFKLYLPCIMYFHCPYMAITMPTLLSHKCFEVSYEYLGFVDCFPMQGQRIPQPLFKIAI